MDGLVHLKFLLDFIFAPHAVIVAKCGNPSKTRHLSLMSTPDDFSRWGVPKGLFHWGVTILVADELTIWGFIRITANRPKCHSPVRRCSRKLVRGQVKKWNESQVPVPDSGGTSKWDFDSITVGMFFFGKKTSIK